MRISIHVELNPYLAAAVTALLFAAVLVAARPEVPGAPAGHTLLPAFALGLALAAGQTSRRPRI